MTVLAVNAGSSSLKFALYPVWHDRADAARLSGVIEGLEPGGVPRLRWRDDAGEGVQQVPPTGADAFAAALRALQHLLARGLGDLRLRAIAHRVVHGGGVFRSPVVADDAVLQQLHGFSALAPLHQPHNIEGIVAMRDAFPHVPQIACFDTSFHASLPPHEYLFALPREMARQGIRRYGFHGLSYQFVLQTLQRRSSRAGGRLVLAHLGNGASLCAVKDGRSCATTMGFSALDGLMMGTRSGALDAGVVLHLLTQGWTHERLQDLLYRRSGLLGVSGLSADVRRLRSSDDEHARLALDMFAHRVRREAGAMVACLAGVDALAFTGGIGEHDSELRADVCTGLAYLGLRLDHARNAAATEASCVSIHADDSAVEVWVVPTDEGRVAAQAAIDLLPAHGVHS